MNEAFNNFMEKITTPERQEGPSISIAQDFIKQSQERLNVGNALTRDERNEARYFIGNLEGLQNDIEESPESERVLSEIKIALVHLHDMLKTE